MPDLPRCRKPNRGRLPPIAIYILEWDKTVTCLNWAKPRPSNAPRVPDDEGTATCKIIVDLVAHRAHRVATYEPAAGQWHRNEPKTLCGRIVSPVLVDRDRDSNRETILDFLPNRFCRSSVRLDILGSTVMCRLSMASWGAGPCETFAEIKSGLYGHDPSVQSPD